MADANGTDAPTTTEPPEGHVRERVRVELSARSDETRFLKVDL